MSVVVCKNYARAFPCPFTDLCRFIYLVRIKGNQVNLGEFVKKIESIPNFDPSFRPDYETVWSDPEEVDDEEEWMFLESGASVFGLCMGVHAWNLVKYLLDLWGEQCLQASWKRAPMQQFQLEIQHIIDNEKAYEKSEAWKIFRFICETYPQSLNLITKNQIHSPLSLWLSWATQKQLKIKNKGDRERNLATGNLLHLAILLGNAGAKIFPIPGWIASHPDKQAYDAMSNYLLNSNLLPKPLLNLLIEYASPPLLSFFHFGEIKVPSYLRKSDPAKLQSRKVRIEEEIFQVLISKLGLVLPKKRKVSNPRKRKLIET